MVNYEISQNKTLSSLDMKISFLSCLSFYMVWMSQVLEALKVQIIINSIIIHIDGGHMLNISQYNNLVCLSGDLVPIATFCRNKVKNDHD